MFRFVCVLLVVFCALPLEAQHGNVKYMKKGDAYYSMRQYAKAIPEYEKYLHRKTGDSAWVKLADCYQRVNRNDRAEIAFKKFFCNRRERDTLNLIYAEVLKKNGKYSEAQKEYAELFKLYPQRLEYKKYVAYCDSFLVWHQRSADYSIVNLKKINSENSDIAPYRYRKGLVFSSNREGTFIQKKTGAAELPLYDLWLAGGKDSLIPDKVTNFSAKLNTIHHECCASFTADYKKIFYTRSEDRQQASSLSYKNTLKMFSATYGDDGWEDLHAFVFNDTAHSYGHPSVEGGEELFFFASDCIGGYGGTDIYVCFNIDNKWTNPINLGPRVNSSYNEMYPFYHADGTLYFSSNRAEGMGGYDIYLSKENEDGEYDFVENLQSPVNSSYDDLSIFFEADKKTGYFSSNRPGGVGEEDIYIIIKK